MMKWGWDFGREIDDGLIPIERHRPARRRNDVLVIDDSELGLDLHDPITFRVQTVQGGTLIETRWYNAKTDNHERKLHIVTSEENLSEAIGKIVTMELIRR